MQSSANMPTVSVITTATKRPCATCPGRNTNLCQPLDGELLAEFFGIATRQNWTPRQFLFRAGATLGPVFKITKGIALISRPVSGGRRQVLRFLLPGDVCGYLAAADSYECDAEAVTTVEACTFPRDSFEAFVARHAAMREAVQAELSATVSGLGLQMVVVGQLTSTERVADFLLNMSEALQARGLGGPLFYLPMTRIDIADYLGMRVETVCRGFSELRRRRLIEVDRDQVKIANFGGLKALAARRPGFH